MMKLLGFFKKLFKKEAQTETVAESVVVVADSELKKPVKKQKSARKVKADTTGLDD
jgi:hypothetical protein